MKSILFSKTACKSLFHKGLMTSGKGQINLSCFSGQEYGEIGSDFNFSAAFSNATFPYFGASVYPESYQSS